MLNRRVSTGTLVIITTVIGVLAGISSIPSAQALPNPIIWATKAAIPFATGQAAVVAGLDGRIYVIGGFSQVLGSLISSASAYDPRYNNWTTIANEPTATRGSGVAVGSNGLIYVISGCCTTSNLQIYNRTSNTWSSGAPIPTAIWMPGATTGSDGRIYVAGGDQGYSTTLTTLQIYNPATNSWSIGAPMLTARAQFQLVAAPNGLLYAMGGTQGSGSTAAISSVEAYNITANTWTSKTSTPRAVDEYGGTLGPDGLIYIFGGSTSYYNGGAPYYGTVYSYYPPTDTWYNNTQTLPTHRKELGAATSNYNHKMYVMGGTNNTSTYLTTNEEASVQTGDPTTTVIACNRSSVLVNNSTSCTATVTDTNSTGAITPTGTVTFTSSSTGTFTGTCSLTGSTATATCTANVTYTPTVVAPGTHIISGTYSGDTKHSFSTSTGGQSWTLTVIGRSTSTAVACVPSSVLTNNGSTCTATVTDTASGTPSTPAGTVKFTSAGTATGSFSPATSCSLVGGSCSVTFIPSGAGTDQITANYQGDNVHSTSNGISGNVTSTLRSSSIAISCPASAVVNNPVSCTVTVTDTSPAPARAPTGTIALSSSGAGTFTSCTLAGSGAATTCSTNYKPTGIGTGSHTLTAYYGGDSAHLPPALNATVTLTVNPRAETSMITCTAPATIGVATTCTVTVTDASPGNFMTPTGSVTLSTSGSGSFAGACILSGTTASSTCSVTYTPGGTAANNDVISYSYTGDTNHTSSSGNFQLVVVPPSSQPPAQTTSDTFLGLQTIYWIIIAAAIAAIGVFFGYFMFFKKKSKTQAFQPSSTPPPVVPSGTGPSNPQPSGGTGSP